MLLTEISEIFGAERILMDRCADKTTFDALVDLVRGFKEYFIAHGEPVSENPSPGNIRGGITTLEEKSLGAVQKAGHVPETDVLPYAGRTRRTGLTVLEGPGNDAVSTTALAAACATLTSSPPDAARRWAAQSPPSRSHRTARWRRPNRVGSILTQAPCW